MGISKQQALDCLRSTDLIGVGMEADAVRRALHPEGVVSYAVGPESDGSPVDEPARSLDMHRQAGLKTTANMVFGAGESLEQRVDSLFAIRELQEESGGFTAFSLSCFQPGSSAIEAPTAVEYMRMLAVSRLVLDNIQNVESNCVQQGLKVFQMALRFGANDAGSLPSERNLSFTEEDLRRVIRDAGFRPVERDAHYRMMYLDN